MKRLLYWMIVVNKFILIMDIDVWFIFEFVEVLFDLMKRDILVGVVCVCIYLFGSGFVVWY